MVKITIEKFKTFIGGQLAVKDLCGSITIGEIKNIRLEDNKDLTIGLKWNSYLKSDPKMPVSCKYNPNLEINTNLEIYEGSGNQKIFNLYSVIICETMKFYNIENSLLDPSKVEGLEL